MCAREACTLAAGPFTLFERLVVLFEGVLAEAFQVVGAVDWHVVEMFAFTFGSLARDFFGL